MKRFYLTHVFAEKRTDGTAYKYSVAYTDTYSTMKSVKACVSHMNKSNVKGEKVYLGAYVRDKLEEFKTTPITGKLGYFDKEHGFLVVYGL